MDEKSQSSVVGVERGNGRDMFVRVTPLAFTKDNDATVRYDLCKKCTKAALTKYIEWGL